MRVIITGGRDVRLGEQDLALLDALHRDLGFSLVLSGHSRGVDRDAESWATSRGIQVKVGPADWRAKGRSAGHVRIREMVREGEILVAFKGGKATADCVQQARAAGLVVVEAVLMHGSSSGW